MRLWEVPPEHRPAAGDGAELPAHLAEQNLLCVGIWLFLHKLGVLFCGRPYKEA